MSVWIWQQALTPEEETSIRTRTQLVLPYEDLPDLSRVKSPDQCRHLLQLLHPDDPPEAISRRQERTWKIFSHLEVEDTIAVPLFGKKEVALAEVTKPYIHEIGEGGIDRHLMEVKWFDKRVTMLSLRKHRKLFSPGADPMFAVDGRQARTAFREKLPYGYNRWAALTWILLIVAGMRLVHRLIHLWDRVQ